MAILRSIPKRLRMPSLQGRLMIDSFRGVLRVRKWPRKRGRPRSAAQRFWVDWFKQANRLAKYADGMSQARAIEMTKDSGLYPRDVLLMAMRGRLYNWTTPDGWRWYSVAAIGDISESLDVLAQTVGSVLVRAVDRWRAPVPGAINDVLTYKGDATPPIWQAPGGGGGPVYQEVTGSPLTVDNTVAQYDFDVDGYADLALIYHNIVFAATDHPLVRLSFDGGSTYKAGAGDYFREWVDSAGDGSDVTTNFFTTAGNSTGVFNGLVRLTNLKLGRAAFNGLVGDPTNGARTVGGFSNFDSPVTNIRVYSGNGNNFKTGALRLTGLFVGV